MKNVKRRKAEISCEVISSKILKQEDTLPIVFSTYSSVVQIHLQNVSLFLDSVLAESFDEPTPATNWRASYRLLKDRRKTLDDLPCSPSTGHLSIHQRLPSLFIHSRICSFIPKSYKTPASVFWGHTGFFSSFLQTLWGHRGEEEGKRWEERVSMWKGVEHGDQGPGNRREPTAPALSGATSPRPLHQSMSFDPCPPRSSLL